ncbi:MAG TPA: hypothetical protein VJP80_01970 [Candidatus Saccharimonadales bacterium]|nr:hypothetical protein [Candidatus Saccharimonadales bacterium]
MQATHLAVKAVAALANSELAPTEADDIKFTIASAYSYARYLQGNDKTSVEHALQQSMAALGQRRQTESDYRSNDLMVPSLDEALVQLAAAGYWTEATALITPSASEISASPGERQGTILSDCVDRQQNLSDEQKALLKDYLAEVHTAKTGGAPSGILEADANDLLAMHRQLEPLRKAGVAIDYTEHLSEWIRFAESIPLGAQGAIIRRQTADRLKLNIGEDPVQAIRIFGEITVDQTQMAANQNQGRMLLQRLIAAEDVKGFPSSKPGKVQEVFFNEQLGSMYQKLHSLKKAGDTAGVAAFMTHYGLEPDYDNKDPKALLSDLKLSTASLQAESRARAAWLHQYSGQGIKAVKLIEAWKSRGLALRNGAKDNPNDILAFIAERGADAYAEELINANATDITLDEFNAVKGPIVEAMGLRYSPQTAFFAIEHVIKYRREHGEYPPKAIRQARGEFLANDASYTAEILDVQDPRGFTIGYDTGCCMTIGGASESCIWAGYEDPRYNFFAVYDQNGKLRAQSLLYFSELEDGQKILVVDNIEANQGTDSASIAHVYRQALSQFLKQQNITVDAINLGVAHTKSEMLKSLPDAAVAPPTPLKGIYTDAHTQKVLWTAGAAT